MDWKQISNAELLDYLAGRLDEAARARVERAVSASPEARRRLEETGRMWNSLGAWQVDVSGMDIRSEVARRVQEPARNFFLRLDWGQIGRIAATWLLAMALGAAAGLGAAGSRRGPDDSATQARVESSTPPSEEAMADALQLGLLGDAQDVDAIQAVIEGTAQSADEVGG